MRILRITIQPVVSIGICVLIAAGIIVLAAPVVSAAWFPPSAQPPAGNVYAPLNTSADSQAKAGNLLLDPYYNPYGELPEINYPLEVRGSRNAYINDLTVTSDGILAVDTDTLYVDGGSHGVGIGLTEPETLLDIAGGLLIGSASSGITGSALVTSSSLSYGALGVSLTDGLTSVLGTGTGVGVYGLHTAGGTGIRAESVSASGAVGSSAAPLDRAAPVKVAGVYGRALGLGSWAGYFAEQTVTSAEAYAHGFVPNRQGYSQYPYTIGWETREITSSARIQPETILYDGRWVWLHNSVTWANDPNILLIDPSNGAISEDFRLVNGSGVAAHGMSQMILAGGYIWTANWWDDAYGVSRVDPNDPTHTATHFAVGNHFGGGDDGALRLAYDDFTTGGPYIWTVNGPDSATWDYTLTRLRPADGTYINFQLNPVGGQSCLSYDWNRCIDGIDNDGDGNIDRGICSNPSYTTQATCETNGGTWTPGDTECINNAGTDTGNSPTGAYPAGDERLGMYEPNGPSGITVQPNLIDPTNPTIWVSFSGVVPSNPTRYEGEAIAKFSGLNPTDTALQEVYCPGPATEPDAITNGDGYIWIGSSAHYSKYQGNDGLDRFDPVAETFTHFPASAGIERIAYDDQSAGGPYIWGQNFWEIMQFNPDGSMAHLHNLPDGIADFTFDYSSGNEPYFWASQSITGGLSRTAIAAPYDSITYTPKGSYSDDIVFDGTYIWSTNSTANTVSRYRASDGQKVGDYFAGWYPRYITFDGSSLWVTHLNEGGPTELAQLDASTGELIGDYDYGAVSNPTGNDILFDGTYVWIADFNNNRLRRIDPATCSAGVCAKTDIAVPFGPRAIAFDGNSIWAIQHYATGLGRNSFSRIHRDTGAVLNTYTIPNAYNADGNLRSLLFDGTYLWMGAQYRDAQGMSLYKVRPNDGSVAARVTLYNEPGVCSGGDRNRLYCTTNAQCTGGGACSATATNVSALTFDGTHVWAVQERASYVRECTDGRDNDGDGLTDYAAVGGDPSCADSDDVHETDSSDFFGTTTDIECADRIDNDGNGLCDWDGAAGSPGCSGKPDPGCSGPTDISEQTRQSAGYLSRVNAGTDQRIESIYYAAYCNPNSLAFDGSSIWINQTTNNCDNFILHQYFAGTGSGQADLEGLANLQTTVPGRSQSGSAASYGEATVGRSLMVTGDLRVVENVWGGSADAVPDFGQSCTDGEFVKGIDTQNKQLHCRPL